MVVIIYLLVVDKMKHAIFKVALLKYKILIVKGY